MKKPEIALKQYPPNYTKICQVFPSARRNGVIFAYGDKIFVPSGNEISHHLKVHEAVHCIRQQEFGVELWWNRYLSDPAFCYHEELLAYRAEYISRMQDTPNRALRRATLKSIAQRLASPLYKSGKSWKQAAQDIEAGL